VLGATRLVDGDRLQVGGKQFVFSDPRARAHVGDIDMAPDTLRLEAQKPTSEPPSAGPREGPRLAPGERIR
jgi:hypothetical protein